MLCFDLDESVAFLRGYPVAERSRTACRLMQPINVERVSSRSRFALLKSKFAAISGLATSMLRRAAGAAAARPFPLLRQVLRISEPDTLEGLRGQSSGLTSVLLTPVAVATPKTYSSTPQGAAMQALYFGSGKPRVVKRLNLIGPWAAVLTSGGVMESNPVTSPILVRHFSFGWQALALLNFRCNLDAQALGARVDAALMAGMPVPHDDRPCKGALRDAGPSEQIEAVRRLMLGPLIPSVVVSGEWAIGEWYGAGGGRDLFRLRGGTWVLTADGGGAMGVAEMRTHGVPESDWCKFGIYDAHCR